MEWIKGPKALLICYRDPYMICKTLHTQIHTLTHTHTNVWKGDRGKDNESVILLILLIFCVDAAFISSPLYLYLYAVTPTGELCVETVSALMLALLCVRTGCISLYIRCPQLGEGVLLLLRVLAEFPGDFSGLRQLLRQVGSDIVWQLLVREGQRRHWN